MRSTIRALAALASAALIAPSFAQTYTNCNPTLQSDCPADSALGRTVNIDFSSESDSFTPQGSPTYGSDGVTFTVAKSGDSPQLTSKWYIMFGKVEISVKAAPGAGIVSSFVLQSDSLDEIDWEWLGADDGQVQTNYFGKGQTTTYNRGAFHADSGSQSGFKKYTIEWTPTQIVWQIDGTTVRTLEPANADNQYPQTPMQVKFGAWSGGDSANSEGTIQWAQGPTDYTKGPFNMVVKSLMVQDYSTGSTYTYGDQTGTWESIKSNGGTVFSGGDTPVQSAPEVTATASGQPIPFSPSETTTYSRASVYPWVPNPSATAQPTTTYANYPGLPSGWTVSDTGKVVPPSSATVSKAFCAPLLISTESYANISSQTFPQGSYTSSPAASPTDSSGDANSDTTLRTTAAPTVSLKQNSASGSAVPAAPAKEGGACRNMLTHLFVIMIGVAVASC
ncbi:transglycosylase [Neocucurbitaria cava]|uniref:Crh-like protein n=1 Tax=Neocucurbitaria cava TaxID=798079 RepID=A0A9W8YGH9_9PLEO|nr:transglycosylase [Neocucurbitaria cava]